MLPHHETEHQWSVNNVWSCIMGNQCIVRIGALITELLTVSIAKNATNRRLNTNSNTINVAEYKTSKKRLLAVDYLILIMYNYPTAKRRPLYESTDGPAGRPSDNLPDPDRLGDLRRILIKWTVPLGRQPVPSNSQRFGSGPLPDPM